MKISFAVLVSLLLLMPIAAAHEDAQPKTTPDKPFYGLSVALDKINLALTFEKNAKAKKGLEIARERLLEVKAMREAGKLNKAQRSADNYAATMDTVAATVELLNVETPEDAEALVATGVGLAEVQEQANEAANELSAEKEVSNPEKEKIDRIGKINEKISAHKKAIGNLEARKAKLKEKVPEDKLKEIEKRHEKSANREAKATEEINKADEEIIKAELDASKLAQGDKAIANAREHLKLARDAFAEKKYGEAFGHANAAYHLALAVEKRVQQLSKQAEKNQASNEGRNSSQKANKPKTKS